MAQNSPDTLNIVKTLSSKLRLEALLLLFIYKSLSLSEISKLLKRTKNTMIYHMRLLIEQDLVEELDEKIPTSIKPIKIYQLRSDFYRKLYVPFEDISKLPADKVMEHSRTIFRYNLLLFETIREILQRITGFYNINQKEIKTTQKAIEFHQNHAVPRDLIPLSEKAFHEYQENYALLMKKTLRFMEEEDDSQKEIIRPYLAFNTILPIKNLFESD